jgi:hypothetical protein
MFMRKQSIKKPSSIDNELFERHKLIYFLRFICKQNILSKDVMSFKTVNDVEQERVKICQVLLLLDEDNSKIYNDEIIEITQNIKIKERIREIDNSKIYVDINGLINYDLKDFDKSFSRFIKIKDLNDKSFEEFYVLISETDEYNLESQQQYKKKYVTHKQQLQQVFTELFIEIRNKYLYSNENGLDSYLSTRIRHGTITGQLRKIFSDLFLITTKNSDTDIYLNNNVWVNENNNILEFNILMNQFSKDIDDYIIYIKNTFIQIKDDGYSEALFNFSINDAFNNHIIKHYFINHINDIHTHEDFIKYSIEICEYIIDNNLEYIRKYFKQNIELHFLNLLESLEKDINTINNNEKYSLLLTNIRKARTDIQSTIDTVIVWFERKKKKDVDFVIQDAIDTSKEIIENLFSSKNLVIKTYIQNEQKFEGKYFINFVDFFKIFLENITTYVRKKNNISSDVLINVINNEDYIICQIKNTLINPTEEELNEIDTIISDKEAEIKEATNSNANRTEDNTGIIKATKIIKISLQNINNSLVFKRDDNDIIIEIKIYKKGLVNENINS